MGRTAATSTRLTPRIGGRTNPPRAMAIGRTATIGSRPRRRPAAPMTRRTSTRMTRMERRRTRSSTAGVGCSRSRSRLRLSSWLVSAALVSFAFVTVVKQNDDHVDALTDLLEEGQAQRGSLLGSAQEQTEQRQAVLLNERAKTRASSAQARESRASREAALADAERSQSEAARADAQARSADVQGALAVDQQRMAEDQQRTDELVAAAGARNEDAQATLARAQAKLAEAQQRAADRAAGADAKLARAQAKLAEAQRRAAEALAALADACRQGRLPGCLPGPLAVGPRTDQGPRTDR